MCRKARAEDRKGEAGDEEGLLRRRETPSGLEALLQMLREWRVWLLAVVWGTLSAGMDGLVFWIPLIIKCVLKSSGVVSPGYAWWLTT